MEQLTAFAKVSLQWNFSVINLRIN
jgi:hypothetical protein